jgi:hypothetical protein
LTKTVISAKEHRYVAVYVDDPPIAGPSPKEIAAPKKGLSDQFEILDLGACIFYFGMLVKRNRRERALNLSQRGYLEKVFDFGMRDCL